MQQSLNTPHPVPATDHLFSDRALIEKYQPHAQQLARSFSRKRQHFGLTTDDFQSAAYQGLVEAAARYNSEINTSFIGFSKRRIIGAMYDLLRREGGMPRERFRAMMAHKHNSASLSDQEQSFVKPNYKGGNPFTILGIEVLESKGTSPRLAYLAPSCPQELSLLREEQELLEMALSELPARARTVITLRYHDGLTFEEIALSLGGLSKTTVYRIHNAALDNLRRHMTRQNKMSEGRRS